jgi:hypothetical protein
MLRSYYVAAAIDEEAAPVYIPNTDFASDVRSARDRNGGSSHSIDGCVREQPFFTCGWNRVGASRRAAAGRSTGEEGKE